MCMENLVSLLGTFGAAWGGAYLAFLLDQKKSKKEKQLETEAGLRATEYRISKISNLAVLRKGNREESLKKNSSNNFFDWEKIKREEPADYLPQIDVERLLSLPLFDYKQEKIKKLFDSILLVSSYYEQSNYLIKERNRLYTEYLDKTEKRESIPKNDLEAILGRRLFNELGNITERVKSINNDLFKSCKEAMNSIRDFLNYEGRFL